MDEPNEIDRLLSFRQYARHRGCSPQAVSDAVAQERISVIRIEKQEGKFIELIDPKKADHEWSQNTKTQYRNRKAESKFSDSDDEPIDGEEPEASSIDFGPGRPPSVYESRAWGEAYKAKLSQVEYERAVSAVLPVELVEQIWIGLLSNFRARMLSIPPKIAPQLQGLEDISEIEQLIKEQIYEGLNELSEFDVEDYIKEID